MQLFISRQNALSSVLLLNSASSESTTVAVNNSTQPVCDECTAGCVQRGDPDILALAAKTQTFNNMPITLLTGCQQELSTCHEVDLIETPSNFHRVERYLPPFPAA